MRAVGAKSHRLAPEVSRSGCASGFWAWLRRRFLPPIATGRDLCTQKTPEFPLESPEFPSESPEFPLPCRKGGSGRLRHCQRCPGPTPALGPGHTVPTASRGHDSPAAALTGAP